MLLPKAIEGCQRAHCSYSYMTEVLGSVRLQNRQIEYELKVRQKERVPSCFDTRLWLYGHVQI